METVTQRLAAIVDEQGGNVSQVAKRAGIDPQTLRKALTGTNNPSYDTLTAILTAYPKYEAAWLLLGKGEKYTGAIADQPVVQPVAEAADVKELKRDRDKWRDMALGLLDTLRSMPVLAQGNGTDGPSFLDGNRNAAEPAAPMMIATPGGLAEVGAEVSHSVTPSYPAVAKQA